MKPIACSTSAFRDPLDDALARVAGLGFDTVDIIAIGGWPHVDLAALPGNVDAVHAHLSAKLDELGLTPIAMNVGLPTAWKREDADQNRLRLDQTGAICDLASRLGIKAMGFYPGYRQPDEGPAADADLDALAQSCREVMAIGHDHGIHFGPEPHFNTIIHLLDDVYRLLDRVPDLRVSFDSTHYLMQGHGFDELRRLAERAAHVHVRDVGPGQIQLPFGEGVMDVDKLMTLLQEVGYLGNASIEYLPKFDEQFGKPVEDSIRGVRSAWDTKVAR
jgi:sugar phosphate isomerase/epimerase